MSRSRNYQKSRKCEYEKELVKVSNRRLRHQEAFFMVVETQVEGYIVNGTTVLFNYELIPEVEENTVSYKHDVRW